MGGGEVVVEVWMKPMELKERLVHREVSPHDTAPAKLAVASRRGGHATMPAVPRPMTDQREPQSRQHMHSPLLRPTGAQQSASHGQVSVIAETGTVSAGMALTYAVTSCPYSGGAAMRARRGVLRYLDAG